MRRFWSLTLLVCLLGNFVDQYDLFLFGSIRVTSLQGLGLDPPAVLRAGILLLNCQLVGMLLGGIAVGMIGDRRGRITILFGSIMLYSAANLANAFVTSVPQYGLCRFLAGFGLAGEIGACITVVLEILPKHLRGYGTMLIMAAGHAGAVTGSLLANVVRWQSSFLIGGSLGILILLLRFQAQEPALFVELKRSSPAARGNFSMLFKSRKNFAKYLKGIVVATPTWFAFGILIIFAPEIQSSLGHTGQISPEKYMPYYFGALIAGDLTGGILSQRLKTRKWVIVFYVMALAVITTVYLRSPELSLRAFYGLVTLFGFFSAYTVMSFTVAAEQFGTNLRATAATSTPNFVRGTGILFTTSFALLRSQIGVTAAAAWIGAVCLSLALIAALTLEETFDRDLDYVEV